MIRISLQFAPTCSVGSKSALVYILAWHQTDGKSVVIRFIEAYMMMGDKITIRPQTLLPSWFTFDASMDK